MLTMSVIDVVMPDSVTGLSISWDHLAYVCRNLLNVVFNLLNLVFLWHVGILMGMLFGESTNTRF